jgi:hypothetical protein
MTSGGGLRRDRSTRRTDGASLSVPSWLRNSQLAAVQEFVRGRLASYKMPRRLVIVDELPVLASRKVDKMLCLQNTRGTLPIRAYAIPVRAFLRQVSVLISPDSTDHYLHSRT